MAIQDQKQQITFGKFQNVDMRVAKVLSAPMAEGTNAPSRLIELDVGPLGHRQSVGQFALLSEEELVGRRVIVCVNLGERQMGPHLSNVLIMGVPHPEGPSEESQAFPLFIDKDVVLGSQVY